ncbi:hypothetical protein HZA73_01515 [candidate division TA06 bacterium]|nr:hypothetical protein [candidate division TA06 bacterium]
MQHIYGIKNILSFVFLVILSAWLVGCGKSPTSTLAPFEPQIVNNQDAFQLQATGVTTVSTTLVYAWKNSGTRATINHSTTTTAGSTLLTIRDSLGTTLYSKALVPSLNEPTAVGVPGTWSVTLTLTNYSGTLNFRAEKL